MADLFAQMVWVQRMVGQVQADGVERRIDDELVRIAVGSAYQYVDGVPFAIIIAIVLSGAFPNLSTTDPRHAWLWVSAELIFGIVGLLEWRRYRKRGSEISSREQHVRLAVLWTFHGLVWGALVPTFWNEANPTNESILCTLVLGVMVGSFFLLSPLRIVFVANISAVVAVTEVTFLLKGGPLAQTLSLILPLFTAMIVRYGWSLSGKYKQAVRLHVQNEHLVESLNAARDRAEAASKAKSQFLANMSHELRTPLNAILGFSEMIAARTMITNVEKHYEYAGLIHRSAQHFLILINDILDLAKIEAGSFSLHEVELDVGTILRESLTFLEVKAEQGGCRLDCAIEDSLECVRADERAVKQMILNLLSNALKFTPPGGRVTAFACKSDDGGLTFGVRDTGVGIAEEDQVRIFENFGQGRHDVVTADKGTGLGLPIVKGLAEAHGGTVELTSTVGQGTTVSIQLPASRVLARLQRAS